MAGNNEREFVGARIPAEKKRRIEEQLSYGESIQGWLEDAIDRKLAAEEKDEGNPRMAAIAAPTAD